MILYGRMLSPFARRVAVWRRLQGGSYENRPLLVTGEDWEKLREINPMGRVPVVVTADGETLVETSAIIDWLEEDAPAKCRLIPASGRARRDVMQAMAYGNSTVEKGVALVYEKNRRPDEYQWPDWRSRLETQVTSGLQCLEERCPSSGWVGGDRPNGADICFVIAHDFIKATNPYLLDGAYPRLSALATASGEVEAFASTHPSA